jgi:hypothetical protein
MKTTALIFGFASSLAQPVATDIQDPVASSFDHDLNRVAVTGAAQAVAGRDDLQRLINAALQPLTGAAIVASFDRELNRVAATGDVQPTNDSDPLHYLINAALWTVNYDTQLIALASQIERSFENI